MKLHKKVTYLRQKMLWLAQSMEQWAGKFEHEKNVEAQQLLQSFKEEIVDSITHVDDPNSCDSSCKRMYSDEYIEERGYAKFFYKKGKLHRLDGPAVESVYGNKSWYREGLLHREDGPAVEYFDGYKEYWYQGQLIQCSSDEEYQRLLKLKAFW